jgi:hypothetical protein
MESVTIAIISATLFGVIDSLTTFIRWLISGRDKHLNVLAQKRALAKKACELETRRRKIFSNKRFDSHYQVLGDNKHAIQYLDQKIDETLKKKAEIIERYVQLTIQESSAIIAESRTLDRKIVQEQIKEKIDNEIRSRNKEILKLQNRRANLWDSHFELQDYLLEQECMQNKYLDNAYQQQSDMFEKIHFRHNEENLYCGKYSIEAETTSFKMIEAPMNFLLGIFKLSSDISDLCSAKQTLARKEILAFEADINNEIPIKESTRVDYHHMPSKIEI